MKKTQPSKINFSGLARMNILITGNNVFLRTETSVQKSNTPFSFIREFARESQFSVSEVDIVGLAYAYVLKFPVVTDDSDMLEVAKEFEISTYKTLELMKLMMDCGFVKMEMIRSIVSYWAYQNDKPKSFRKDFTRLFSEDPPG